MTQALKDKFAEIYGAPAQTGFFSPGRVNLIGEHVDYNGGYVFPCALTIGTAGLFRLRGDERLNFASANFERRVSVCLNDLSHKPENGWASYMIGVVDALSAFGRPITGFDCLVDGTIPNGAGLSSSASILLLMADMLNETFKIGKSMTELVKLCQKVENEYIGLNCGIMDQFAVGMGKKNHAILLDCGTLAHEYVPLTLGEYSLVITNTNKRRGLTDSKYNERRAECDAALAALRQADGSLKNLCALTPEAFRKLSHLITDDVVLKRARHVVEENARTLQAVSCLKQGDIKAFGRLMNESHASLRDLYEVTGKELDTLVSLAWEQPGVLGSRMTGAGFGGCTVSIVHSHFIEGFRANVGAGYESAVGCAPSFYAVGIGDGTRQVF